MKSQEIIVSGTEGHSINPNYEIIKLSGVDAFLNNIRPAWQAKNLIQRTKSILPVDPSSACQRIFNASIHDLKEKVIIAGIDIAQATAELYRLPKILSEEDITERYDTSKLITLAHRMGLLSRPDFRKIMRVYDIRKDLEHEDDQYEAGVADVVYVFSTCIDIILANDPIHILKIKDIKNVIENPQPVFLDAAVIEDYQMAPTPRQFEIFQMLISTALDTSKPDILRENSFNALAKLSESTHRDVILQASVHFNDERLDRRCPVHKEMRIAYAAGILPYLRSAYRKSFFETYYEQMKQTSYHWTSHNAHGELLRSLKDVGGLSYVTDDIKPSILEWLILCYLGEPGGYGQYGHGRKVFYSNVGASLAFELIENANNIKNDVEQIIEQSKKIKSAITNKSLNRRLQEILDIL